MSKATGDRRFVRISGFGLLSDFVIRISSLSSGMNENTKHQAPNTKEAPNPKLQLGGIAAALGIWSLEFLWSLASLPSPITSLPSPITYPIAYRTAQEPLTTDNPQPTTNK